MISHCAPNDATNNDIMNIMKIRIEIGIEN